LCTLSEEGNVVLLHARQRGAIHIPALLGPVRDVSRAGDTVAAALAVMLSSSRLRIGDACGQRGRQPSAWSAKSGPSTFSPAELRSRILPSGVARAGQDRIRPGANSMCGSTMASA